MKDKVRYGVIGTGHMGQYHVNVVRNIEQANFVGIYDANNERAKEISKKFNTRAFSTIEELLENVDALSCAVPTSLHYALGTQILKAKKHLLIEKPIASSVKEAKELISIAKKNNLILHVGHVERFNGAVQELSNVIQKPLLWESRRLGPNSGRITDTGVIMDLMIHDIDICIRVVNSKVEKLEAFGVTVNPKTGLEDAAVAILHFENGCVATLSASRLTQEKVRTLAVSQPDSYVFLDFTTQDLHIHRQATSAITTTESSIKYKQESMIERVFVHKENPLQFELTHFIKNIQQGKSSADENSLDLHSLETAIELTKRARKVI